MATSTLTLLAAPDVASFDIVTADTAADCGHHLADGDVQGTNESGDTMCRDCSAWGPAIGLDMVATVAA